MNAIVKSEYTIKIVSDMPPQAFIGDMVAGGRVVEIASNDPELVSVTWLNERFPHFSKNVIRERLAQIKQGTTGKYQYDREMAIMMLKDDKPIKRGRKRKN